MNSHDTPDAPEPDFRSLWETQNHEVNTMSTNQLNRRLTAFKRGLLVRKAIAVFAAILSIKLFIISLIFWHDGLMNLGFALLAAWVCLVAFTMRPRSVGANRSVDACSDYFQTLLKQERSYLASGTIWGPLLVLPVAALLFWRIITVLPDEYHLFGYAAGGICLFGALTKILFFRWRVRRLDAEIAALQNY